MPRRFAEVAHHRGARGATTRVAACRRAWATPGGHFGIRGRRPQLASAPLRRDARRRPRDGCRGDSRADASTISRERRSEPRRRLARASVASRASACSDAVTHVSPPPPVSLAHRGAGKMKKDGIVIAVQPPSPCHAAWVAQMGADKGVAGEKLCILTLLERAGVRIAGTAHASHAFARTPRSPRLLCCCCAAAAAVGAVTRASRTCDRAHATPENREVQNSPRLAPRV